MKAMLSRVADALYWLARYMERAENVARFVDVHEQLALDAPGRAGSNHWASLVATTGDDKWFREHYGEPTRDSVTRFLLFDRDYSSSLVSSLRAARENARSVREVISRELWECMNRVYLMVADGARNPDPIVADPDAFLRDVKNACHQFAGTMLVTMTHNEAWRLMTLGRVIERADKTSRLVDVKYFLLLPKDAQVGSAIDELQWAALLRSVSALEMYRKKYGRIVPRNVIEFLLLDTEFPRAIRYCVERAQTLLIEVVGARAEATKTRAGKRLGRLQAELEYAEVEEVMEHGLHEWLDRVQKELNEVGAGIHELLFGIKPPPAKGDESQSAEA